MKSLVPERTGCLVDSVSSGLRVANLSNGKHISCLCQSIHMLNWGEGGEVIGRCEEKDKLTDNCYMSDVIQLIEVQRAREYLWREMTTSKASSDTYTQLTYFFIKSLISVSTTCTVVLGRRGEPRPPSTISWAMVPVIVSSK